MAGLNAPNLKTPAPPHCSHPLYSASSPRGNSMQVKHAYGLLGISMQLKYSRTRQYANLGIHHSGWRTALAKVMVFDSSRKVNEMICAHIVHQFTITGILSM